MTPRGIKTLRPPAETALRHHLPDETGRLAVTCWCEAAVVSVPRGLVVAGQTTSCGAPGCEPEEASA